MARWAYRGLTTRRIYTYNASQGAAETLISLNGENCVYVNADGSEQRGTAGAAPAGVSLTPQPPHINDVFDTYAASSRWETS